MNRNPLNLTILKLLALPLLLTGLTLLAAATSTKVLAELQDNGLEVQNPTRSFGYFVGDILEQKINLDSSISGHDSLLVPDLPSEQRINEFLYRLSPIVETNNKQRWLSIRYQVINAPDRTTTIFLPEVTFNTQDGATANTDEEILLHPWSFNIAPLTTEQTDDVLTPLPDRPGHALIEKRDSYALKLSLVALISTLLLWTLWWIVRHFSDAHTLPFAKARRKIKKLPATERDTNSESWVALHHAFNDIAGKTISSGSTDALFAAAPWLTPEKQLIDRFYNASSGRFYQGLETPEQIPIDALSRSLYRLEKRQVKRQVIQSRSKS